MGAIEQGTNLKRPEPAGRIGLDENARSRLISQFRGSGPDARDRALVAAGRMASDILRLVDQSMQISQGSSGDSEPFTKKNSPELMAAVHILDLTGHKVDYGPSIDGNREISTTHDMLLSDVESALSQITSGVDRRISDEAFASVYSVLRDRRDDRRRKEREEWDENFAKDISGAEVVVWKPGAQKDNVLAGVR